MAMTVDDPIHVLSREGDATIVRIPNRAFPAIAIQGDTFEALYQLAVDVASQLEGPTPSEDVLDDARELVQRLATVQRLYEKTLAEHGLALPYSRR